MRRTCSLPLGLVGLVLSNTAAARTGGPDAFGYTFVDSASPGGPSFSWIPSFTTLPTISNCDDCSEDFVMPIDFTFYGTTYPQGTNVQVSSNGYIQFPDGSTMAPWTDDLYPGGGGIRWSVYGSAPNRQLVVSWNDLLRFGEWSAGRVTFEVVLTEGTNEILYQYADATFDGTGCDWGSCGWQYGISGPSGSLDYGMGQLSNNLAVRYSVGVTAVANGPYSGTEPNAAVALSAAGSIPGYLATIVSYDWDCTNDGTYDLNTASATASCTYPDSGVYTVRLRVNNSLGATSTATSTVTITNVSPTITSFTVPAASNEGASINVTSAATDPAGALDPLTYTWSWGDGSPNTVGANASHTFADNGSYTVMLSVTDGDGGLTTQSRVVTVANVAPTITVLTVPASGLPSVSVPMSATATDPGGVADPLTYTWVWGDGTPNGTGANPSHSYAATASYTVQLTVTDGDGGSATQSATIVIGNLAPVITSAVVPGTGNEGASVSVSAAASDLDPLTYTWAWGDGSPNTTGANTTHTFADNGTYTVTLTVTDGALSATATRSITVANVSPTIGTYTVPATSVEGSSISVNSAATDPAGSADTLTYTWSWGDGSPNVVGAAATHTYADQGTYTVGLTVVDEDGGSTSRSSSITVSNVAPTITSFTVPATGDEGSSMAVSGAATDPAGAADVLTYTWSWGDGSPNSTGANVSHTFADNGTYTVTLAVTDGDGGLVTQSRSVTVANVTPTITAMTVPAESIPEDMVAMSSTATDPAGAADPLTYTWVWGDGTPDGSGANPSHSYAASGTYTVTVTVTDGDGGSTTQSASILINNVPPVITSAVVPASGDEGASVSVSSAAIDLDPLTYVWAWGDTTTSTGASASHTYADDGTYTVTLTVTDTAALSASTTRSITIANVSPTIGTYTVPSTSDEGASVAVSSGATDPAGGLDPLTYAWSWGDGSPNGAGAATTHTYALQGTYAIALTVTDGDGGSDVRSSNITVANTAPTLTFMTVPAAGVEGASVSASGAATDLGPDTLTYTWAWGDSTTSTGPSATHTYANDGTYTVTLTVTDGSGATATDTRTITIANASPTISSITVPATANEGASVAMSSAATDPSASDVLTYTWAWGDGTPNGTGASAAHTYVNEGTYTVSLTVTDGDGGSATQTRSVTVANVAPTVATMVVPAGGFEGSSFAASASATDPGTADVLSYEWAWGDSSTSTGATPNHTYANNGSYLVTLTVSDDAGATASATRSITIANVSPTIGTFTVPATGTEGSSVSVNSAATDPGADTLTYTWSWGDGSPNGSGAAATHTYANHGTYTVGLLVTDDDGGFASRAANIVVANVAPTVTSMTVPGTGTEGMSLGVSGTATDAGSGPLTYTWSWGDASPDSIGVSATHVYVDDGSYTVTLTVGDGSGDVGIDTRTVVVANASPTISSLTVPATGNEGSSVAVTGLASDLGAADALTYTWNWGDATEDGVGASVAHTFANQGSYTVRLTVSDGDGGSVAQTRTITVANLAPSVTSMAVPAVGVEGASFGASATATDPGTADVLTYTWAWDDGSPNSTGATPSHTYANNGTYTVTLTVADDSGATASDTRTIVVANAAPVITSMTVPATGAEGGLVAMSGAATDPGSDALTYTWSWGDGTPDGAGASASHTYANEGAYTVTLTVADGDGGSVTQTRAVTVANAAPIIASVTVPAGDEGVEISASAIVSDPGTLDLLTYSWAWGDSTVDSTGAVGKHTYADDGSYVVVLTVTDDSGASVSSSKTVVIANVAPTATVEGDDVGDEGQELAFSALAVDVAADTVTYLWDYGDGTSEESVADVLHTFADDGPYTITLTVEDEDGGSSTATWDVLIDNTAPLVALTVPAITDEGAATTLAAVATDDGVNDVLTVTWDFGDGTTGTGGSVDHAWKQDGTYTVTVTVDDGDGGQVIDSAEITVNNVAPVIARVDVPASGVEGDDLVFAATASDPGADVLTLTWDFGDGSSGTGPSVTHAYADNGAYVVLVVATDGGGGRTSSVGQTITVGNANPVIVSTAPLAAAEGVLYTYTPDAIDPGAADALTWALSGEIPAGMTIDGATGEVRWTPTYDETLVATYAIVVTATDDDGGFGSQAFTLSTTATDGDGDGMPTAWELVNGLDPTDASDAALDPDSDGWSNLEEYLQGTDPNVFGGPSRPTAFSPVQDAVVGLQPTLVLTNATDAEGDAIVYEYEVYADAGLIDVVASTAGVVEDGSGKTAWDVDVELAENTHGWWRARGNDGTADGPWSAVAAFHVDSIQEAPSDPVVWAPIHDDIVTNVRPALQWTPSIDPDEDALSYTVEVHDASGALVAAASDVPAGDGLSPESWVVDVDLDLNASYTWTVLAIDEDGLQSGTSEGSFLLRDGIAPLDVAFISPEDQSQIEELSPMIELTEATHGDPASLVYTIELDTALTFDSMDRVETEVDGTGAGTVSWDLAADGVVLGEDLWWYARARAVDALGLSSDWALVHFLVRGENSAPSVPELSSPDDASEVTAPVLVVADAVDPEGDAISYVFRVSTDPEGNDVVATSDPVAAGGGPEGAAGRTSWVFTGEEKGTLYWSAQAIDDRGAASDFAAARSFVRAGGCGGCSTGTPGSATPIVALLLGLLLGRRRVR